MARYFQDVAGTIPARDVGDPIALIRRAAGTVDAVQTTPEHRPTLGVTDWGVWYLNSDGTLPVIVPAGQYGLAYVDVSGGVTTLAITSDGASPINVIRTEHQVDVILRAGAFDAGEVAQIEAYWGRYAPPQSAISVIVDTDGAAWASPDGKLFVLEAL